MMKLGRLGSTPRKPKNRWMRSAGNDKGAGVLPLSAMDWIVGKSAVRLIASAKPARRRQSMTSQGRVPSAEKKMRKTCFICGWLYCDCPTDSRTADDEPLPPSRDAALVQIAARHDSGRPCCHIRQAG